MENSSAGGGGVNRENEEDGDRNMAGNRWPREETVALLNIRSEMDIAFRDSNLKAPLWDEVSRKLAEVGYNRSAKKCKEKFENIYKYHRRIKDGRSGRHNSKNYRFFDQLELLNNPNQPQTTIPNPMPMPISMAKGSDEFVNHLIQNPNQEFGSTSTSTTSSTGKESEGTNKKKKRKMGDFLETLLKKVLDKQERLQNEFMEAIEKAERDRIAREEAWKMQELARKNEEHEQLAQERAVAAAKDAALIAFLQRVSEQPGQFSENPTQINKIFENPTQVSKILENPIQISKISPKQEKKIRVLGENVNEISSSRWPKTEIEALIRLRTNLDLQYQDNGPKGPLWEEISLGMKRLGYNRNAKRCKEKWENINKYYKRVKEGNKKRPQDSKTCPYFHMLENLTQMKSSKKFDANSEPIRSESVTEDGEFENLDRDQDDEEDEDEEEDYNLGDYRIVANNNNASSSMATIDPRV